MIFYAAVVALGLVVGGDAGVIPRAPIQSAEKEKRKPNPNVANTVNNLSKSGMDRKKFIILLSVILGLIIISCAATAFILYKRHKDAQDEAEERRERRRQQQREKAKKKEKKRQAEPRPSEDDEEERTLVDGARPSMQADPFPPSYDTSNHQRGENQFSTHSTRSSYVSDGRVEPVQEESAPFLDNAGPQRSA
ncbi:hypothetical protein FS837_002468 [Tulasnella sp. UAMH 9824]|nr:hypothetical protein FS837_002468 [Tulasnella sp. UAMH 9824]